MEEEAQERALKQAELELEEVTWVKKKNPMLTVQFKLDFIEKTPKNLTFIIFISFQNSFGCINFMQKPTSPSLWWAVGNRLNVWLMEVGPIYGFKSSTALWITWESERLREATQKENLIQVCRFAVGLTTHPLKKIK